MTGDAFAFRDPITLTGKPAGKAAAILIRRGKAKADDVAHKFDIRAQIMRDIAPAIGRGRLHEIDLPEARQKNVEWAADELEAAGEMVRDLARVVPRTALDALNEGKAVAYQEDATLLRSVLRKTLAERQVQALDALSEWSGIASLSKALGVSHSHAANLCAALFDRELVERKRLPEHVKGHGHLYRACRAWRAECESSDAEDPS